MDSSPKIASFCIVSVDHYMTKPRAELDPTYSEFRGVEIKSVPVIRIFGINTEGDKCCLHVHGVFPYMYIPYAGTADKNDGIVYQIACSLDKAINISLGQSTAQTKHVFKVVLVKGIPFYGYHASDHQYLKIYFYNPNFVKRAAGLFQNGAILGNIYQAHDSHVPYILKFFIDYNLYGMSFLHVPENTIKERHLHQSSDVIFPQNSLDKISTCKFEYDIISKFILNPLSYNAEQSSEHINPGISSIWKDERKRRENLDSSQIPSLQKEPMESRPHAKPTESDIFYRKGLLEKLERLEEQHDSNSTQNMSLDSSNVTEMEVERNKKFNLKSLLFNAVYPAESSQLNKTSLTDASFIDNPYSRLPFSESHLPHLKMESDTMVDEEIALSLSQRESERLNESFSPEELELLEVMRLLENQESDCVDNDSLLAPLSQTKKPSSQLNNFNLSQNILTQKDPSFRGGDVLNASNVTTFVENDESYDSDDDLLNNFSIVMEEAMEANPPPKPVVNPPLDEWESSFWNNVNWPQFDGANDFGTPKKQIIRRTRNCVAASPRSLAKAKMLKYSPLDIQINRSPKSAAVTPKSERKTNEVEQSIKKLRRIKKLDLNIKNTEIRSLRNSVVQSPPEPKLRKLEVVLKKCDLASLTKVCEVSPKKLKKPRISSHFPKLSLRTTAQRAVSSDADITPSPTAIARHHDKKYNLCPEAGPSNSKKFKIVMSPVCKPRSRELSPEVSEKLQVTEEDYENTQEDNENVCDSNICSFYDKTVMFDDSSVSIFGSLSPKVNSSVNLEQIVNDDDVMDVKIAITPKCLPPDPKEVAESLVEFDIPDFVHTPPFFSNTNDVMGKKEVGYSVLRVLEKNACNEFTSLIENLRGINDFKKKSIEVSSGDIEINNTRKIREFLATEKSVVIYPVLNPPTRDDAVLWHADYLQAKMKRKENPKPVVRQEKLVLLVDGASDDENQMELTLSPPTPESVQIVKQDSDSVIDLSTDDTLDCIRRSFLTNSKPKARLSLAKQFNEIQKENIRKSVIDLTSDNSEELSSELMMCGQRLLQNSNTLRSSPSQNSSETLSFVNSLLGLKEDDNKRCNLSFDGKMDLDRSCEISGTTLDNTYGFKLNLENLTTAKADVEFNYLTILSLELYIKTRANLKPDPDIDPVFAIVYAIQNNVPPGHKMPLSQHGMFVMDPDYDVEKRGSHIMKNSGLQYHVTYAKSEKELFENFLFLVSEWDPDIFLGYEIEMSSWGYLIDRGFVIELNMPALLSRIPSLKVDVRSKDTDDDREESEFTNDLKIPGRIIIDVWRLFRHEIALTSYSFENVMYHILHRRHPLHSHRDLTRWWNHARMRWMTVEYYMCRVKGNLELIDQLDLIGRTCELAKLFGIQFYEVLSRGSQFRVESMMLRMAKPRNFVPVSPSVQQRAHMRAPEYLPLILEPQSRMYLDPLIVLDFQSLYPSMMIAYNYCYSTSLGRVEHLGQSHPFEFGASQLRVSNNLLRKLLKKDLITVSPCGVAFVKESVREGTVSRMVHEILDTRLMVKQSMKLHKNNNLLQRVLHSRQLGLKLIANVTYGYTAANWSGRMPCVEIADSILSKGRETLERAIKLVEENDKWRVKVVYGDTDSLFVLVPGRNREEAFRIGAEIAKAVTDDNPYPVKLKLEKVYQPSILQTKKRYVGFMYETPDQKEPVYEAKGIETVRRDGCPAVTKMLEKTLRILFQTKDVSLVKNYICRQFTKILSGRINIQDLIFAKEFRGVSGYKAGACVPALELTRKWTMTDKRAVPRRGERVPFIIANGPPGLPLIRLVRSPHEMLSDEGLKINAIYYINKVLIPPLNRCLLLIGVDVNEWMANLPRKAQLLSSFALTSVASNLKNTKKSTISQYFSTTACIADCGNQTRQGVCESCLRKPQKSLVILHEKISRCERKYDSIGTICKSCCGRSNETKCLSLDCPVLFTLERAKREYNQVENFRNIMSEYF